MITVETARVLFALMMLAFALAIYIFLKIKHASRTKKKENTRQSTPNKILGSPEENDLVVAVLNKMNIDNLNKQSVYDRITFNIAENVITVRVYNDNYSNKYNIYISGFYVKGYDNEKAIGEKAEQIYNEWVVSKYKKVTSEIEES